jgi:hypothetical protein
MLGVARGPSRLSCSNRTSRSFIFTETIDNLSCRVADNATGCAVALGRCRHEPACPFEGYMWQERTTSGSVLTSSTTGRSLESASCQAEARRSSESTKMPFNPSISPNLAYANPEYPDQRAESVRSV